MNDFEQAIDQIQTETYQAAKNNTEKFDDISEAMEKHKEKVENHREKCEELKKEMQENNKRLGMFEAPELVKMLSGKSGEIFKEGEKIRKQYSKNEMGIDDFVKVYVEMRKQFHEVEIKKQFLMHHRS